MVKLYNILYDGKSLKGIPLENIFIHRDDQLFPLLYRMPVFTEIVIAYEPDKVHQGGIYDCYCAKLEGALKYDSMRTGISTSHTDYSGNYAEWIYETDSKTRPDIVVVRSDYAGHFGEKDGIESCGSMILETFLNGGMARIKAQFIRS